MKSIRKRRQHGKTDYKSRLALIKSGTPRLVIRKTNRYIIAQIVKTEIAQDKVILHMVSKDLISSSWPKEFSGSMKSIPAAYLTGFLLGKKAKAKKIEHVILDIGMHRSVHKSRIYAVLKGALDAGLHIAHDKNILLANEKIQSNEKFSSIINKFTRDKV